MAQLIDLGGAPVNQAERDIIDLLVRLPGSWAVAPNVNLPDPRTGHPYEYDAIVIGPHAVYVVEVKGWRGQIRQLNRHEWQLQNGRVVTNPLPLTDQKARVLSSTIKSSNWGGGVSPYVQACLVAGTDLVSFDVSDPDGRRCLRPRELHSFLLDPKRLSGVHGDFRRDYRRLVALIQGKFEGRPEAPRRYGSYVVSELQERDDESATWIGHHALLSDGRVYRIRAWYLSDYRYASEERASRLAVMRRNAEALAQVGDHPCVAPLRDFGEGESGEFYEITDWSEQGTLQTAHDRGVLNTLSVDAKLTLLRDIAQGLDVAWAHGVVHRALSPRSVLLTSEHRARLCRFERAWMSDAKVTVYGKPPASHRKYVAPELRDADNYEVYDNSDLYSLGEIARFLFPDALPEPIRELVERCLRSEPRERPADPGVFLRELDAVLAPATPPAALDQPIAVGMDGPPVLEPGHVIDGVNHVLGEIGRSASSIVFRVSNESFGQVFALKLIHSPPEHCDAGEEFRALRGLKSPHVPTAHYCGKTSIGERPLLSYLLLDLVEGRRLRELIDEGPLETEQALGVLDDLLEGLGAIHRAPVGLLHRDIKPDNVLISQAGAVLLDFGIARPITHAGATPVGTLRYTPPDLSETGWQPQADIFALGCVAYEMLAGMPPWDGLPGSDAPPLLSELRDDVPEQLAEIIARSLAPRSADRFSDPASMREALRLARSAAESVKQPALPDPCIDEPEPLAEAPDRGGLWTAARVQELTEHPYLQVPLAHALRDCVVEPTEAAQDALLAAFLASEARAKRLEAPLVDALPSCYGLLAVHIAPLASRTAPDDEDEHPGVLERLPEHCLVRVDGLHFTETLYIEQFAAHHGRRHESWVWCAGPSDPDVVEEADAALDLALLGTSAVVSCELGRGARERQTLGATIVERRRTLEGTLRIAFDQHDVVWVASTYGVIYLGHGLRIDPGEGLDERAEAIRDLWSNAFRGSRLTRDLALPLPRDSVHLHVRDDRRFVLGRLAWPDRPGTPWLQAGGLSLPERILTLHRISRANA